MKMDRQVPSEQQPEQQPTWRRRPRLVQPALQLKFSIIIALFGVIFSLTFCSLLYLQSYETQKDAAAFCGSDAVAHFASRGTAITGYMLAATGLITTLMILFAITATHRVAGPVLVMTRYLKQLGEGQIPSTRPLRKQDELQEFYGS